MARIDPLKKAAKWANKMANAGQDYRDGIDAVQVNPAELAIAKQETLLARFREAVERGDWAAALRQTTLSGWKEQAKGGAGRLVDGAKKGQPKMQAYLTAAAPIYEANMAEIRSMPNGTESEREARMIRNKNLMKQMKGLGKRR